MLFLHKWPEISYLILLAKLTPVLVFKNDNYHFIDFLLVEAFIKYFL